MADEVDAAIVDLPFKENEEFWMVSVKHPHHLDKTRVYTLELVRVQFKAQHLVFMGRRTTDGILVEGEAKHVAKTPKQAILKKFNLWKDLDSPHRVPIMDQLKAWWAEHKDNQEMEVSL